LAKSCGLALGNLTLAAAGADCVGGGEVEPEVDDEPLPHDATDNTTSGSAIPARGRPKRIAEE